MNHLQTKLRHTIYMWWQIDVKMVKIPKLTNYPIECWCTHAEEIWRLITLKVKLSVQKNRNKMSHPVAKMVKEIHWREVERKKNIIGHGCLMLSARAKRVNKGRRVYDYSFLSPSLFLAPASLSVCLSVCLSVFLSLYVIQFSHI